MEQALLSLHASEFSHQIGCLAEVPAFLKPRSGTQVGEIAGEPGLLVEGALALGLTGMGGDASKYLLSAANGALGAWAANQGRAAGLAGAKAA